MKNDEHFVEWFLSFVNVELEKLSPGDVLKLVTELEGALRGVFYEKRGRFADDVDLIIRMRKLFPDDDAPVRSLLANGCRQVKRLQEVLRDFVGGIMKRCEDAEKHADSPLSEDEFTSLGSLGSVNVTLDVEARIEAHYGVKDDDTSSETLALWKKEDLNEATFKVRTSSQNSEEALIYQFLTSLNGLPLKALRKCPMCGNWFLHLSKRKREFCSNKCAARKTSRQRYKDLSRMIQFFTKKNSKRNESKLMKSTNRPSERITLKQT